MIYLHAPDRVWAADIVAALERGHDEGGERNEGQIS